MRITRKTKSIINICISILLLFGIILGACALFAPKSEDGYKEIRPDFRIGAIDSVGAFKETKRSLFTEDSFECADGLKIELDFINAITYQVFFYDETDNFISSSVVFDTGAALTIPEGAERARIKITPTDAVNDSGKARDLNVFDVFKYSGQITVMVGIASEEEADDAVTDSSKTSAAALEFYYAA